MYTSSVWQRLALNLIEFIQSKVWRSFNSLEGENFVNNLTTATSAARCKMQRLLFLKLFSGKSSFRLRSSSKLNVPIDNFTVI